jgi:outer membrane protein assembly factor BamB
MESIPASVIVRGEALILIEPDHVQVLNTKSGESYWLSSVPDDEGVIHVSRGTGESRRPILAGVGVPQVSGIVDHGNAFATLGWPILVEAESELRVLNSQVAAFDIAEGEGLTNWLADDHEVLPENWRFTGRPAAAANQIVIPTTTRSGPIALGLSSLDQVSGELNWHREICGVIDTRSLRTHRFGQYLNGIANGHIIWNTAAASVLRIDATNGDIAWAVTYPSDSFSGERLSRRSDASKISEPVVADGVVYAIGVAGRRVLAIDEVHGVVRWTTTFPSDVRHILGEHNGVMVVAGDLLWGLDTATGEVVWKCGFESPEGAGVGKGLVAGGAAWWTTRDALFATDIMSGNLITRVGIREAWDITGGDLYLAEDHLLILSPDRLSALAIQSSP